MRIRPIAPGCIPPRPRRARIDSGIALCCGPLRPWIPAHCTMSTPITFDPMPSRCCVLDERARQQRACPTVHRRRAGPAEPHRAGPRAARQRAQPGPLPRSSALALGATDLAGAAALEHLPPAQFGSRPMTCWPRCASACAIRCSACWRFRPNSVPARSRATGTGGTHATRTKERPASRGGSLLHILWVRILRAGAHRARCTARCGGLLPAKAPGARIAGRAGLKPAAGRRWTRRRLRQVAARALLGTRPQRDHRQSAISSTMAGPSERQRRPTMTEDSIATTGTSSENGAMTAVGWRAAASSAP